VERPTSSQGKPLEKFEIYEALFDMIDDVLFHFSTNKKNEDDITQKLEISLNEETRIKDSPFAFQNQYKEGNFATDIGVYIRTNQNYFCWIEAKRLPTPNGKNKRDEREYVFVDKKVFDGNGGIQRFKEGKHASKLSDSIMIGYIQDNNNADYWLSKINIWINELRVKSNGFWKKEDCLIKLSPGKCDRFLSRHKRRDGTIIILHHYWIKL
jgi:hypothetical protein